MSTSIINFIQKLKNGPAVLLLGQDYLKLENGNDPLLKNVLKKFNPSLDYTGRYDQLLQLQQVNNSEAFLAWVSNLCDHLSPPQWLEIVAKYPWNSVFTSAIDTIWYHSFFTEWRRPVPIYEDKTRPIDPRSRINLQCNFLFGCVDQLGDDIEKRPPLSNFEKRSRKLKAASMLDKLPEIVTALGVLVIEGYFPSTDWLSWDQLLPIIDRLGPEQVHIFNVTDNFSDDSDFMMLVSQKKITMHSCGLAECLVQAEELGLIKLGLRPDDFEGNPRIQVNEKTLFIPPDLWNQVSRTAQILEDSLITPDTIKDNDQIYYEFREFLSRASIRPLWSGFVNSFNFEREFEINLYKEVHKQIYSRTLNEDPIILHGQSGTGKSVALGALAYKIRAGKKCAVLFIERKSQKPSMSDIDIFCKWAEDNGSPSTLIIWDGMKDVKKETNEYAELLQVLTSRGRKVVLVGSSYLITDKVIRNKPNFVEAPAILNEKEFSDFTKFLNNIDSHLGRYLQRFVTKPDEYFLVALYRVLPATKKGIREGIIREVRHAQHEIETKIQKDLFSSPSSLAYGLYEAGFITEQDLKFKTQVSIDGEETNEIQELIGLVMVPGKFGLKVPFELILRALSKKWMENLAHILETVDIFRWYEDLAGNIYISPRHPLEAEFFIQANLGLASTELAYAKKLLIQINPSNNIDSSDIQFAVDLIRRMGPNGDNPNYYSPYFKDLSLILREVRIKYGVENPRLMLQEATLLREWIKFKDTVDGFPPDTALSCLEESFNILKRILTLLGNNAGPRGLLSTVLVEMGATLAGKNKLMISNSDKNAMLKIYDNAKHALVKAISENSEDYHPFDIVFWMAEDLLKSDLLEENEEIEIKADLFNIFSLADPDEFDIFQRTMYFERRHSIGELLARKDISDEAFESLVKSGSKAGYFLRAVSFIKGLPKDKQLTNEQILQYQEAVHYLEQNRVQISADSRCLNLLLKLWWMSKNGKQIFYGERQTLSFSQEDWKYALNLTTELLETIEGYLAIVTKFIKALALFHLNDINTSFELFRDIEAESNNMHGKRRIIRSYLASNEDGTPKEFRGLVNIINLEQNRGDVYISSLRSRVRFIPKDFQLGRSKEIKKNEPLENFHIAFNFIGPIADPKSYKTQSK